MKTLHRLLLAVVALGVVLTAVPAFAEPWGHEGYRPWRREERRERWEHERREHEWWRHRRYGFYGYAPFAGPYCHPVRGYWAWTGWRYVWVPPQVVCE